MNYQLAQTTPYYLITQVAVWVFARIDDVMAMNIPDLKL